MLVFSAAGKAMEGLGVDNDGIPAVHVLQLVDLVRAWQVTPDELLDGLDLDPSGLEDPHARVSLDDVGTIASRAHALTREPLLGAHLGLRMRASAHGYLGFAAMTSSTVREALELAARYAPTRTSALALRVRSDGPICSILVEERVPLGHAKDVVLLALLVGLASIGAALTGGACAGSIEITSEAPDGGPNTQYAPSCDIPIRFARRQNRLCVPAEALDLPIVHADRVACKLAEELCEQELASLRRRPDVEERVRALLARTDLLGYRSLDEVAAELEMSPRTLRRRLADKGTNFTTLLEREQKDRALALLRHDDLSLGDIAARLGYANTANFARAFRRWTGAAPAAHRRARAR